MLVRDGTAQDPFDLPETSVSLQIVSCQFLLTSTAQMVPGMSLLILDAVEWYIWLSTTRSFTVDNCCFCGTLTGLRCKTNLAYGIFPTGETHVAIGARKLTYQSSCTM